ncbi:MAG: shikimate dehydrogenase [Firmicutes bacterium]|nr:shikimate dehydrogenase [Bacillota bacterium]
MENRFAFIIHPIVLEDIFRKFKALRHLPRGVTEKMVTYLPPIKVSEITGVVSPYGEAVGNFVSVNLTSKQMLSLPEDKVIQKIIQAGKKAQKLGAKIVGLGAMTSVVGDAGISIARNLDIAVTTGNSYTVATALEGTKKAAEKMGIDYRNAQITIIGATGSIGAVCARILAREAKYLTLAARNISRLESLARDILYDTGLAVKVTSDIKKAVQRADILISVSGASEALIEPQDLKTGAVVCDVARPRDVSPRVEELRDDVLVIEGGVVEVPGDVNFNFNFGFPKKTSYACMAETMILALEGRFENFSLGRNLKVERVDEITSLARKHGFKLAGFRSFERPITDEKINNIRKNALRKKTDDKVRVH